MKIIFLFFVLASLSYADNLPKEGHVDDEFVSMLFTGTKKWLGEQSERDEVIAYYNANKDGFPLYMLYTVAYAYYLNGDNEQAAELMRLYCEKYKKVSGLCMLAKLSLKNNMTGDAIRYLDTILEKSDNEPHILYAKILLLESIGDYSSKSVFSDIKKFHTAAKLGEAEMKALMLYIYRSDDMIFAMKYFENLKVYRYYDRPESDAIRYILLEKYGTESQIENFTKYIIMNRIGAKEFVKIKKEGKAFPKYADEKIEKLIPELKKNFFDNKDLKIDLSPVMKILDMYIDQTI